MEESDIEREEIYWGRGRIKTPRRQQWKRERKSRQIDPHHPIKKYELRSEDGLPRTVTRPCIPKPWWPEKPTHRQWKLVEHDQHDWDEAKGWWDEKDWDADWQEVPYPLHAGECSCLDCTRHVPWNYYPIYALGICSMVIPDYLCPSARLTV